MSEGEATRTEANYRLETDLITAVTPIPEQHSISRAELVKRLAEMWANNLITYDEMKAILDKRT